MESRFTPAKLILSTFGDSIEIRVFSRSATNEDNIHPLLKKGLTCNGCDEIFIFLKEIQKNTECLQFVHLAHHNNRFYQGHMFYPPEMPHPESIESMIMFVDERIRNPTMPEDSCFDRMGTEMADSLIKGGCQII